MRGLIFTIIRIMLYDRETTTTRVIANNVDPPITLSEEYEARFELQCTRLLLVTYYPVVCVG